nr:TetR/AcrR family transcriptional regulator C-terminal domain-containing protein [Gordonia araii]
MGTEVARRIAERANSEPYGDSLAEALRTYAAVAREEYLAHRDGARTFAGTRLVDPEVLRRQEGALRHWAERGIPLERIIDAYDIVTAFVVGFVIEEQDRQDAARYSLPERDAAVGADHPLVVAAGHHGFRPAQQRFDEQLAVMVTAVAGR